MTGSPMSVYAHDSRLVDVGLKRPAGLVHVCTGDEFKLPTNPFEFVRRDRNPDIGQPDVIPEVSFCFAADWPDGEEEIFLVNNKTTTDTNWIHLFLPSFELVRAGLA